MCAAAARSVRVARRDGHLVGPVARRRGPAHRPMAPAPRTRTLLSGSTRPSPTPRTVTASGSVSDAVTGSDAVGDRRQVLQRCVHELGQPSVATEPIPGPPRPQRLVRPVRQKVQVPHVTFGDTA